jgi:hypothetical protein
MTPGAGVRGMARIGSPCDAASTATRARGRPRPRGWCLSCAYDDVYAFDLQNAICICPRFRSTIKDCLGHANIQHTTSSTRLTTATLDAQKRASFASHRVV